MSIITPPIDDNSDVGKLIESYGSKLRVPLQGVPTGFPELDRLSKGLLPRHLIILGAESGVGKSVFVINILVNLARSNSAKCLYLDLENGVDASIRRFVIIGGEDAAEILKSRIYYRDHISLESELKNLDSVEKAKMLQRIIEDYVIQKGVRVVVIDPLEELELVAKDSTQSFTAIQKVVAIFRDLAQKFSITIIIIHHLRKMSSDSPQVKSLDEDVSPKYRIPTLYDFVGTMKIVNTATDCWAFVRQIHSPSKEEQGRTLFRILKARETPLGDMFFEYDQDTLRFRDQTQHFDSSPTYSPTKKAEQDLDDYLGQQKEGLQKIKDQEDLDSWKINKVWEDPPEDIL